MCCQYRATDCLDFMFRLQETHHSNMFACVDMNGATPLIIAARIGWSVKKLVRNGSPEILRIPDGFGRLPIHYAAIRGDINDLKELLHAGSKHYQLNKVDSQYKRAIDLINTTELNGTRAFKYLTREMLKKGFLAKNSIYVSTSHSERLIKKYLYNLENIFINLGKLEINNIKEILNKNN